MKTIISTKKTCETSVQRFDSDYSKMSDVEPYVDNFVPDTVDSLYQQKLQVKMSSLHHLRYRTTFEINFESVHDYSTN